MPRLTIAIPTVNRADLLGRAIESALAQTSPDIEVLVSDNGSTDTTPSVIARYSDPRLRTFRHERTMPAGKHGQFLMEQARGEFFLGLSDDDFLEPEFAAEVLAAFDRHPECVFVYTGCAVHYEDIQVPAMVGPPFESGAELLANHYSGRREISWCACVTRVRLLRELGPQPPEIVLGDMFFWTRMALLGPVGCVPRVLSHYILLRPQTQNDNISHGTPPIVWARESRLLVDGAIESLRQSGTDAQFLASMQSQARDHVARSTANQFVWTRIRGASLPEALRWSLECLPYLSFTWPAVSRMLAAMLVPPSLLRKALLRSASRMAAERRAANPLHTAEDYSNS
jgi:Glycosyl transferase family 2